MTKSKYLKSKNIKKTLKGLKKQCPNELIAHLNVYIEQKLLILAETSYNKKRLCSAVWNIVLPLSR